MSVLCSGRTRVVEQLGEKQDFEAELSRRGFRHEEFTLHVRPSGNRTSRAGWDTRYEVRVTHAPTQTVRAYHGGPRENWVARFARDLSGGLYGEPTLSRSCVAPHVTQGRHRSA
jgi:hypothetical protein